MLVLTRKPREEIRIGNGITITILRVKGQAVRVGIDAPNDVRIVRGELSPEEVVENNSTPDTSAEVETTSTATNDQRTNRTASLRNRCEKTTSLHTSDSTACSSRLSSPRRNGSALQAIVARNRAANAPAASPVPSRGSGPPR